MTELIIVESSGDDEPADVAEVAETVAETVAEAIADAVEQITTDTDTDTSTVADVAFVAGATMAETVALTARVAELEEQLAATTNVAELALDIAIEEPVAEVVEEPEPAPEEDIPPATRKNKFNKWWFGERPGPG